MDSKERERLVKLLGMTGSNQDGEALNALRLVNSFLQDRKLTWDQVITTSPSNVNAFNDDLDTFYEHMKAQKKQQQPRKPTFYEKANWIMRNATDSLNPKEKKFVDDMTGWNNPSKAQLDWLDRIYQRVYR